MLGGDANFKDYQASFNSRTTLLPHLRALCKTARATGVRVDWCKECLSRFHAVDILTRPFAKYQLIYTRMMNAITVDPKIFDEGLEVFMTRGAPRSTGIYVVCDAYGGAGRHPAGYAALVHRGGFESKARLAGLFI
jgi:hypothetical protein